MNNLISRQAAIDARRYTFGHDEFSLESAYHDCKLVFDGITDDDSFQRSDTGLILYYANEIIYALQEALEGKGTNVLSNDCISRQDAIDAIEKLDIPEDMCVFEILSHIELTIGTLPSAQPEPKWIKCEDCMPPDGRYLVSVHGWGEYDIQIAICRDSRWYHRHPDHIIAWKKLPRPYGNEVYGDAD